MGDKNSKLTYRGFQRSIYILLIARMVNSMGNFVFPFMTLLLTAKGGMSTKEAGFFLLLAYCVQAPGSLLGGKLADIVGRKLIQVIFMGLAACCYIPCAFLVDSKELFWLLPWLLILSCFFNSFAWPANGAMVNDLTLPDNRQAAMSLLYMGMNIGMAIGSVVAGFLFHKYMQLLFLGDALTTFIAVILLMIFVKETKPSSDELESITEGREDEMAQSGGLIRILLRRPGLMIFAALDTIYSFVYAQTNFSIPLQVKEIFGDNLGSKFYGTFGMINCLEVILLTTLITLITRKIKAIYNISIAGIFFGVGFGMLFFAKSFWLITLSTIIWTIGEIIHATNTGVYLANHTPASHRGRFHSVLNIVMQSGGAVSPYLMGGLIDSHGVTNVWPILFLLSMGTAAAFFILGKAEKSQSKRALRRV